MPKRALLKAGKIDAGFEVPCQVIENGDATEISLVWRRFRVVRKRAGQRA